MGPRPHLSFCACKTAWFAPKWQVHMGSSPHLWFCVWKTATLGLELQVSAGEETSLYGSQTSPVIFCKQNSVPSIRITSLHGSQPSCVLFGCKTATFGLEQQVPMIPRHNLSFYASKTAWLAPELLVSMCLSPHLWFLNAKQRILDQNYKSLRVPDFTCRFVHAIQCN